jgi:tryptophan-rich sensory protein
LVLRIIHRRGRRIGRPPVAIPVAIQEQSLRPFSVKHQAVGLLGWLLASYLAAAVGAIASIRAGAFYAQLARPDWAPPAEVFGPVWTVLYALMAIAAWLVWRVAGFRAARTPLVLFLVQLVVNASWSWLFFAWHLGGAALADILLLWVLVVATLVAFWRVRPLAAALLVPYLLWISFAMALNWSVWQLNPQLLG